MNTNTSEEIDRLKTELAIEKEKVRMKDAVLRTIVNMAVPVSDPLNISGGDLKACRDVIQAIKTLAKTESIPQHQVEHELNALREKMQYVEKIGLRIGVMRTSDRPQGFLAHIWDENSTYNRMFQEWSDSIGWEDRLKASKEAYEKLADVAKQMYDSLTLSRIIICEGANTGFNPCSGDWADRLFKSNSTTFNAVTAYEKHISTKTKT